jgi:putative glutathione S-transferase
MGMLIEGKWEKTILFASDKTGHFLRPESAFRNWVTQDGSSNFHAEPHRYHLYISYACPWACRALIFRALKGLEEVISFSFVEPLMLDNGWEFGPTGSETQDPINHKKYLYEIYQKADPHYTGKITVPVLWDKHSNTIVNNESSEIIRMLNSEFNAYTQNTYDYYPMELRPKIDELNAFIYDNINNGVYKCGFAISQEAYEQAFDALFFALDKVEQILSAHRYLLGSKITEADWRLFTTLIRFDVVYFGHFKCNLRRIEDYPNLSNYLRDLYQVPKIKETVNFKHIKQHYYGSHRSINPTGIIPKGPAIDYDRPHNRER